MSDDFRELVLADHEQVKSLCETIWEGNDYVPDEFPQWVSEPKSNPIGIFQQEELVALGTVEKVDGTTIGWVKGLRVKDGHRDQGIGSKLTGALAEKARELGIRTLWYATSSRNEASQHVAEKNGFTLADKTGYFRLFKPYPAHSKPSPSITPLQIDANRLYEVLCENPDLVQSTTFPVAWAFDFKSVDGLNRLMKEVIIKVIIDEAGRAQGFYCLAKRKRNENYWTAAYTVFATDRSIFVDIIARTIDEAETLGAERAVYFLGPRATEWSKTLGYVDEEYNGRRFLLYELNTSVD